MLIEVGAKVSTRYTKKKIGGVGYEIQGVQKEWHGQCDSTGLSDHGILSDKGQFLPLPVDTDTPGPPCCIFDVSCVQGMY